MSNDIDWLRLFREQPSIRVVLTAHTHIIVEVSDAWMETVQVKERSEVVGRYLFDVTPADEEFITEFRALFSKAADSQKMLRSPVYSFVVADKLRSWATSVYPVPNSGPVSHVLLRTVEVTDLEQLDKFSEVLVSISGSITKAKDLFVEMRINKF